MPVKKDQDSKPAAKLLSVYTLLLFGKEEMSLGDLARELNCSKQTAMRLMDQLEASRFGKVLRFKRGRESFYCLEKPNSLPKISLNAEGLQELALCRDFMLHLLPDKMRRVVDTTLQQASAYLPENDAGRELNSIGQTFVKGRIDYTAFQDAWQVITKGIRQHKVCIVEYQSNIGYAPRNIEFAPKRLVAFREAIHIHGWVVNDRGAVEAKFENYTTLALHRMRNVVLTRRSTQHLDDIEDEHAGAFGLMEAESFMVKVKFAAQVATFVAERKWSDDQKITVRKDGSLTLTMTARSSLEVISWILSFGDKAELLLPKWLRDEVAGQVKVLYGQYAQNMQ